MAKNALMLWCVAVLVGCAQAPVGPLSAEAIEKGIKVQGDALDPTVLYLSPYMRQTDAHGDVQWHAVRLAVSVNRKTRAASYFIVDEVTHRTGDWLSPRSATYLGPRGELVSAPRLEMRDGKVENCDRYGCLYFEQCGVEVSRAVLDQWAEFGVGTMRMRVSGQRVAWDADIWAVQIKAFLAATDRMRASHGL